MLKKYSREEALNKLKNLCRRKEISQKQAIEKFCGFGFSYNDAQELLLVLVQQDYVDDLRYAGAYIHDKLCLSHWGRMKINQKLFEAGIAKQTSTFAWKRFSDDFYREKLRETMHIYRDKYLLDNSWECQQKFLQFLANRGFEKSICIDELNRIIKE